jgi:hypothetical protein
MNSPVKILKPLFKILSIFVPCHSVHSRRNLSLQAVVTVPQQIDGDMVEQSSEP